MEHGAESIALLHKALDLGINYYDTADLYDQGENEVLVGKALRSKRQALYIATKVGNQLRPDGTGWDWNPTRAYILDAVEHSLKRLQTDYIDLYQLHGGTIDDPMDETIEAFELLKDQGKIRAYGISSIRPNVIGEYVARSNIASVMMQYSLLDRRPEESCLELLRENGIGVMVRGAVAKGLLVDKPPKAYLGYTLEEVRQMSNAVKQVSSYGSRDATADRTPAQAALQFVLQNQAVCSVVAGMRTKEQLK
jgi:aryl-alcohol dehydrogenase-like predicted oxidoreductase